MTRVLQTIDAGYQHKKGGNRINHLMFMNDIKMYGKSVKETDTLIQTVRIVSGDIRMEFGIEKCALVNIQKGKMTKAEGIRILEGNSIKHIDETRYKYLGIIEGEDIKRQDMKDMIRKEYMQRLKVTPKSKLNVGNMTKAINTWAVPIIRYSAGVMEWTKAELHSIDQKTRKPMTIHKALYPRANAERLRVTRKEDRRRLLKTSEDEWLRSAREEGLIKGLLTGTHTVKIKIRENTPSSISVNGYNLTNLYNGQKRACYKCGQEGHMLRDCHSNRQGIDLDHVE
ncbi:uncharacterized protein [Macrobrachium rosenbergii]|uniref:uncharacterized protein n=1 Tax=Macrobrachium rosenbergii TaxID=79674 RepID=UPI0034D55B8B